MSTDSPNPEGDAMSAFAWGLRRYAALVILCMLLVGVLLPTVVARTATQRFNSVAQVGPVTPLKLPNLDALPRTGQTTFSNGAVADVVRNELGLADTETVIPRYAELVAPQDNVVFNVVGHASTPDDALNVANRAAAAFVDELNKYSDPIGTFALQRPASAAQEQISTFRGAIVVLFGAIAGFILGLGLVALLLVMRRPVFTASGAQRVTSAPVLATIINDPSRGATLGLPRLCQRLRGQGATTVYLVGPESSRGDRVRLASDLSTALGWRSGAPPSGAADQDTSIRVIEDPVEAELATRAPASITILVLRVGTREETARLEAEYHLGIDQCGVVLIRHRHSLRGLVRSKVGRQSARGTVRMPVQARREASGVVPEGDGDPAAHT